MFQLTVLPPPGVFSEFVLETWNDVGAWFHGKSLRARTDPPAELAAAVQGDVRRQAARLVQERIRYVAVEVGEGRYLPREPSLVAKRLYGDCKDKSFLLMALLAERDVAAFPVLTRSREGGRIDKSFPSPIQFDHLIVALQVPAATGLPAEIRLRDGAALLFDPTDSGTPYGQLPGGLQGSRGLVIRDGGASELVEFPFAPAGTNRFTRTLEGEVSGGGRLNADVTETGEGALSGREILQTLPPRELEQRLEQFVEQSLPGSHASKFHLPKPESSVGPVERKFSLSSEQYLRQAGDFFLLPVVPLSIGPHRIPRLALRRFPIVLGVPAVRQLTASFRLPDGFRVDALPDSIEVENRYARYRFSASIKEGRIETSETYETREPEIPALDVAAWKALENAAGKGSAAKAVIVRGN